MLSMKLKSSLVAISVATVLSACGGSSGTPAAPSTSVTSSGTITQFGSVYVNGVQYESRSAVVKLEDGTTINGGNPMDDDTLKTYVGEGNIVKVRGTKNDDGITGTATTITIDNELVGSITTGSIIDAEATFVINGQTITVMPETIIDDSIIELMRGVEITNDLPFSQLNPTTEPLSILLASVGKLEISGFPTSNGIQATRIEDVNTSTTAGTAVAGSPGQVLEDEVKGFVSNASSTQFNINSLVVSYDASDLVSEDFGTATAVADGQFVEVHGSATSTTSFDATRIELENDDDLIDDDFNEGELEVEGIVTAVTADSGTTGPGTITINSVEIPVDDVTQFSVGMHIEIKAVLQNGSLQVIRVQDEAEDTIRTEDEVETVNTLDGTITTRLGLVIKPTDRSRLEDDTDTVGDNPSIIDFLGAITEGSTRLEARGFPGNSGIIWTRIEIEDNNDTDCRLRGPATNITGNVASFEFEIEGITINVNQVSENNFEGANDLPIGRQAFFDAISADTVVVQATSDDAGTGCQAGTLTAREVELEPANDVLVGSTGANDNEITNVVSNVDGISDTFTINGETILVESTTLIDDSIVEDARGVELPPGDLEFGPLPETLDALLNEGSTYEVVVDRTGTSPVAVSIEDL